MTTVGNVGFTAHTVLATNICLASHNKLCAQLQFTEDTISDLTVVSMHIAPTSAGGEFQMLLN